MGLTKVGSKQMLPSRTVDSNNWTVTDWGSFKEYEYSFTNSSFAIASGEVDNTFATIPMPTGLTVTAGQVELTRSYFWANTSWTGLDMVAWRVNTSGSNILVSIHTRTSSANNINATFSLRIRINS